MQLCTVGVENRSNEKELRSWVGDRFPADNADIVTRQVTIVTPFQFQLGMRRRRGVPVLVPLNPQFGRLPPRHNGSTLFNVCSRCACTELAAPSAWPHSKALTFVCRRGPTLRLSSPRVLSCLFRGKCLVHRMIAEAQNARLNPTSTQATWDALISLEALNRRSLRFELSRI